MQFQPITSVYDFLQLMFKWIFAKFLSNDSMFLIVDDTGRVSIWNMAPIIDVKDEEDENVPKMLCLLDNHSGRL